MSNEPPSRTVTKLTGVYHADGGLIGELSYVVGKLRGTTHCALCDITHGKTGGKKRGFSACEVGLGVPMDLVHLNERSPDVRAISEGRTPCVIAHTADRLHIVVDAGTLDRAGGSVGAFERALRRGLADEALVLGQ